MAGNPSAPARDRPMHAYKLVYLPTNRTVMGKDGLPVTVSANTEIGAKRKMTAIRYYVDWSLHVVVPLNDAEQHSSALFG